MPEEIKKELKKLNNERTMASELIAGVGMFLDASTEANCPKLKDKCDELITTGLAMIKHHTDRIAALRNGTAKPEKGGK